MATLTCEPVPNSQRASAAVASGKTLPSATPATMQPPTHTVRYRSKKSRRFGTAASGILAPGVGDRGGGRHRSHQDIKFC